MNIFYIPSWFPTQDNPISGIFFKEQAIALGKQSINICISTWQNHHYSLTLLNPFRLIQNIKKYNESLYDYKVLGKNVYLFDFPRLESRFISTKTTINDMYAKHEFNIKRVIRKFGSIDAIHAQVSYPAGYIAMKLSEKYGIPYCITEHMGPFPFKAYARNHTISTQIKSAIKEAKCVIAVSNTLSKEIEAFAGIKPVIIPNMVDTDFFDFKEVKNSVFHFFTLASIVPEKGILDLLKAAELCLKRNSEILFRIGGDGPFIKEYKKYAKLKNIAPNINWLGPLSRNKVRIEMQNCDAFVLPSHHESFGLAYLEAMSCGKPVLATKCGGPEDFVNHRVGILVEKGSVQKLANAMLKMTHVHFDNKYINQYSSKFSASIIAKKIIETYKKII